MPKGKIGIIGSGMVAQALGAGFLKHGYSVTLGTRDPGKLREWWSAGGKGAEIDSSEAAARFGDIIVLAVKGTAAEAALKAAGIENLKGKTVIDTTNPIADEAPVNGVLRFFTGPNESLLERLQKAAPEAEFVKAFSCIGSPLMVDPKLSSKPAMFICGRSEKARRSVADILEEFGFEVEDMGGAEAARAIEPLAMLWCIPGLRANKWNHAFKLLRA